MVLIGRQAARKLGSLSRPERTRLSERSAALDRNPDDPNLDTRKLQCSPFCRLRVGDWRVIYDRQDAVRIITIERIKARGDAYK